MLGDFASLDVQNTYRGSDAYVTVNALVKDPERFDENYQLLQSLDLDLQKNARYILYNPEQFEKNYQRLKEAGLNQAEYIKIILNNPKLIDKIELNKNLLLKINKLELNQVKYIQAVLDNNPKQSQKIYQRLQSLGLNQAVYIEKVFNQPKQFEKNYQRLETMGLSQRAYVEKIINKAELIDEIELNKYALLKLNSAGLNQAQHVQSLRAKECKARGE
ncbi:hypothetical protein ACR9PT_08725 [Piscirickettsia salmonis]|uniref:hypothetical protein n=1 Tax=Piscirickettsia salmonis TaxID=1238 RepID=UPI003EB819A5